MNWKDKRLCIGIFVLILCLIYIVPVIATPPTPLCDERIEDKESLESLILSNEVISRLNKELKLTRTELSDCFVGGNVMFTLFYQLPSEFSPNNIIYRDKLVLSYCINGTLYHGYSLYGEETKSLNYQDVIDSFKDKIKEVESNERVKELIEKQIVTSGSFIEYHAKLSGQDGWVEYSNGSGEVRGYLLPNSAELEKFPEIKKAHEIVEKNLLIGELSDCTIGREGGHSYTLVQFHDNENTPWYITVALHCEKGWKDAYLQLNQDDSYERLEIRMDYNVIKPQGFDFESGSLIIITLILLLVIIIVVIMIHRRN